MGNKPIFKTKLTVVENLANEASPPLVLMVRPPTDPMEREVIGNQIWAGILMRFEDGLSEQDKALWHNPPTGPAISPAHLRVMHMFDGFLLNEIYQHGPKMFFCVGLLQRLFQWAQHNPELLGRLGEELEHHSLTFLGQERARLPHDLDKFADKAIPELDRLLRKQRDHFGCRTTPTCEEIATWTKAEIRAFPGQYDCLSANLAQLVGWMETVGDYNPSAARRLRRGTLRASTFFYLWYSDVSKRSLKDVKNQISRLRASR